MWDSATSLISSRALWVRCFSTSLLSCPLTSARTREPCTLHISVFTIAQIAHNSKQILKFFTSRRRDPHPRRHASGDLFHLSPGNSRPVSKQEGGDCGVCDARRADNAGVIGGGRGLFAPGAVAGACPGPHVRAKYAPARTTPRLPPHPSKIPPA